MNVSGNTILITGGATGIGLELARAFVERDNEVLICGRRADRLDEAKKDLPALHVRVADVSTHDGRADLVQWLETAFPRMNILINNAGVQHRLDLRDVAEIRKAEEEVAINFFAPMYLAAMLLPQLQRQAAATIVNVSSGLAFAPLAHMPVYCATKAALHSMTMSLRHQLRDTNVRVFEIIPPLVKSELGSYHRPAELNRIAMPTEKAVDEMLAGLERDEYEIAVGEAANSRVKRDALFPFMNPVTRS